MSEPNIHYIGRDIIDRHFYHNFALEGPIGVPALVNQDGKIYDITEHLQLANIGLFELMDYIVRKDASEFTEEELNEVTEIQKIVKNRFLHHLFVTDEEVDKMAEFYKEETFRKPE